MSQNTRDLNLLRLGSVKQQLYDKRVLSRDYYKLSPYRLKSYSVYSFTIHDK